MQYNSASHNNQDISECNILKLHHTEIKCKTIGSPNDQNNPSSTNSSKPFHN